MFKVKVNTRSKKAMADFLANHFRYDTMNSCNRSTSYAQCLKVRILPRELQNKAYELIDTENFFDVINELINDFALEHGHYWQAGFNGRSGGYLVLYVGSVEPITLFDFDNRPESTIKAKDMDYQDGYGWVSFADCKKRGLYKKQSKRIGCCPGKGVDMDEDFADWDIDSLKNRVALVQSFDQLCDDIVAYAVECCKECVVETKTRNNPVKYKVMA
jgi:hypothetical protein